MKQLSVQKQNFATEEGIRREVAYWRTHPLPRALEVDFPGMPRLFGTLVTAEGRFVDFEIETDKSHSQVEDVAVWMDSTDKQDFGLHNRGTGVGAGALALTVLREINADA